MKWIYFKSLNQQEVTVSALLDSEAEVVAKKIDNIWRITTPDLEPQRTPQSDEDLLDFLNPLIINLQDLEFQALLDKIQNLRFELLMTPVVNLLKSDVWVEYQKLVKIGLKYTTTKWEDNFNKEQSFLTGVESQLSKVDSYSKIFSQVFKGLNPKSTRNVFEVNLQMFLKDLKVKNLITLPSNVAMDNISKAFFRKSQTSVEELISDLS